MPESCLPLYVFPPLSWWRAAFIRGQIDITLQEPYRKMGLQNRYKIAAANGPQLLSIPLAGGRDQKGLLKNVGIAYSEDWRQQHWRSIYSAYGRAPYFEFFAPWMEKMFATEAKLLQEFSVAAINGVIAAMRLPMQLHVHDGGTTIRHLNVEDDNIIYYQGFAFRNGFVNDCSILDAMMHLGPGVVKLLQKK